MRDFFGSWKYIFKNLWFVLPFALVPAVFLALSLDYSAIHDVTHAFFTGAVQADFGLFFHCFSFVRIDSLLGGLYSIFAVVGIIFFTALMLSFVEKHMRIGKRTFSGTMHAFLNALLPATLVTLVYVALYELWALIVSALFFLFASVAAKALFYVLSVVAFLFFGYALLYIATTFYLYLPCRLMTGFGLYNAFLYSYQLMVGVRWKLLLSYLISYAAAVIIVCGFAFLPEFVFRIVSVVVFILLYLNFTIRMEVVYFETDKLDREDILHSFRGY